MQKSKLQFKIQNFYFLAVVLSFALLVFSFNEVEAAKLDLTSQFQEIGIGQKFQVDLILNTENEEINAVEGKIIFPSDLLELKDIQDGNSIVNFWVERPKNIGNEIIFSGITPGGYKGEKGLIFSVIFQTKSDGEGIIEIREAKTLLNDGEGTSANLSISNFQFLISKQIPISQIPIPEITDTDPPEPFEPVIGQDPEMFDGKYFLVFVTQDKGSGIDHYKILEKEQKSSIWGLIKKDKWQVGESPYLLKDQKLKSHILVKAVDRAGNERIAELSPQNPLRWYENYFVWLAFLITIIITYIIRRFLWKNIAKQTQN